MGWQDGGADRLPWGLFVSLAGLALESHAVIGLRLLKLSRGGHEASVFRQAGHGRRHCGIEGHDELKTDQ
jgi:hypothetical protein